LLEAAQTPFNTVRVTRTGRRIDMDVAGATFATWHPTHLLTGYSWDAVTAGCLLHPTGSPKTILMLGLAGGTVARQLRQLLPEAAITAVEIDPGLVRLARRHMQLDELDIEILIADAYAYIARSDRAYDVVIDDIYLTGPDDVERPQAVKGRTLERLCEVTRPDGVLVANMITDGAHQRHFLTASQAFADTFPRVANIEAPRGFNTILVGGRSLQDPLRLADSTDAFPTRRDRTLWRRLCERAKAD
jgi:spermidine synthase